MHHVDPNQGLVVVNGRMRIIHGDFYFYRVVKRAHFCTYTAVLLYSEAAAPFVVVEALVNQSSQSICGRIHLVNPVHAKKTMIFNQPFRIVAVKENLVRQVVDVNQDAPVILRPAGALLV